MDQSANQRRKLIPVACTLSAEAASAQVLEWAEVRKRATSIAYESGVVSMTFPVSMQQAVADLARREAGCCAFLTLDVAVTDGSVHLEISSANPEAQPVLALLAGQP